MASSNMSRRAFLGYGLSAASLLALAGCGATTEQNDTEPAESSEGFPLSIEHAFGVTTIESKPERIATLAWSNHEVPLALGVVPVGISAANFGVEEGEKLHPWVKEAFTELGVDEPVVFDDTDGIDFEALNDTAPDVILCPYSGYTEEDYVKLSEIAPTIPYPEEAWALAWRDVVRIESEAMGLTDEGVALTEELEALIATKSEEAGISGQTAAFLNISATDMGTVYVYFPKDPRAAYLNDLGFETPASVTALMEDETSFAATLSAEQVDTLSDIDVAFLYGDEAFLKEVQDDALLGTVPCLKNGSVVLLDNNSALAASATPGALSIPYTIDEYLALIKEVLDKA